jgi:hypothetical protein
MLEFLGAKYISNGSVGSEYHLHLEARIDLLQLENINISVLGAAENFDIYVRIILLIMFKISACSLRRSTYGQIDARGISLRGSFTRSRPLIDEGLPEL